MRSTKIVVQGIISLLIACPWVGAQKSPPRFELFAEEGASILNSGSGFVATACPAGTSPPCLSGNVLSNFSKTGRLVAGARFRFTRRDALEASYSFSPNHFSYQNGTFTEGPVYNRVDLVSFNYVRYLWTKTPIQPFATTGVGLNRFSGPQGIYADAASIAQFPFSNSDNGLQFAWNFGGGVDLVLQRHFAVRAELRDYVTAQPNIISGASHNIVPSAGIVYRFH